MPKLKLTKTNVSTVPLIGSQTLYFDTRHEGFGVRVGTKSRHYICYVSVRKKCRIRITLGKVGVLPFEEAAKQAEAIILDATQGITPDERAIMEGKKKRAKVDEITLKNTLDNYGKARKKLKASTIEEYKMRLNAHVKDWMDLPMESIDGTDVMTRHGELGKISKAQADNVFRIIRALYNYAMVMHEERITRNPVMKLSALNAWYRVGRKTTYVPASELPAFFEMLGIVSNYHIRDAITIMLFTGARKMEVLSLPWSCVDLVSGIIIFRDTKTGTPLEIPICGKVRDILKGREMFKNGSEYVFPGIEGHLKNIRKQDMGGKYSPHDLRRSFQSYCEALRVPVFTIKRLVNHALPQDVTEGYIQFHMDDLRKVVESVENFILRHAGVLKAENVVVLDERRA